MRFHKVVGKIPAALVAAAEKKLSEVFLELSTNASLKTFEPKTLLLGDPLVLSLSYTIKHICTTKLPTAATDGRQYFWNPNFIMKQSYPGLRFVLTHEVWHAIYMHPTRRGSRLPKLWNIAVDYIVNGVIFADMIARQLPDYENVFKKHLGDYWTLEEYANILRDPHKNLAEKDRLKGNLQDKEIVPDSDEELTDEQVKKIEDREKVSYRFFADPKLPDNMKSPEAIYDYLWTLLPKCPDCGKIGVYPKKKKDKKDDKKKDKKDKSDKSDKADKDKKDSKSGKDKKPGKDKAPGKKGQKGDKGDKHDHGDEGDEKSDESGENGEGNEPGEGQEGQSENPGDSGEGNQPGEGSGDGDSHDHGEGGCGHGDSGDGSGCGSGSGDDDGDSCGGCDSCGDGIDIFDIGGTIDDHMDPTETQEKLAKRMYEAIESAKKMPGYTPAGMEEELATLTKPQIRWQDTIRIFHRRCREGKDRNDYNRFKTRPMFGGLMVPKRKTNKSNFICLVDTSGSMSQDDIAYGLSQLQAIDSGAEGTIVPADCEIYWDDATKIKGVTEEELKKFKVVGRGGTMFNEFVNNYKTHFPDEEFDFMILITDGFIGSEDVAMMEDPGVQVFFIITNEHNFTPPVFAKPCKVFNLRND